MNPVHAAKALMAPRSLSDRADPPSVETEGESTTEAGDNPGDGEGVKEQKANDSPV